MNTPTDSSEAQLCKNVILIEIGAVHYSPQNSRFNFWQQIGSLLQRNKQGSEILNH
jgi:hypothetical protein